MLNQSAASAYFKNTTRDTSPSSCALTQDKLSTASLPTPSPDRTTPQQDWEPKSFKNRKPWSAGGYALPFQTELKFRSASVVSFRSASEHPDSDGGSYESPNIERHSRTGSIDSTSIDMELSQTSLPSARPQQS
ncbi:hypothetical protein QQS21_008749, partial [Conoideocrella luteorostrata]